MSSSNETILQFLAKPENLSIAFDVANYLEELKENAHRRFWQLLHQNLQDRLEESSTQASWSTELAGYDQFPNAWIRCYLVRSDPEKPAYIEVCLEQQKSNYRFYLGLRYHDHPRNRNWTYPASLERLQQAAQKLGYRPRTSWWIVQKYLPYSGRGKNFIQRMSNEEEVIMSEITDEIWTLFTSLEPLLLEANQEMHELETASDA